MMMKRFLILLAAVACGGGATGQVTGGRAQMEFLKLPASPHVSALGGLHVATPEEDVAFGFQNPALLRPALSHQLGLSYNAFYAGSSIASLQYAFHHTQSKTTFGAAIQYLNYGSFQETDASGNIFGEVKASEFVATIAAGRQYGERWRYGAALKYASSRLAGRSSAALLADVGVAYEDTAGGWVFGATAKNIGFVVKKYNPASSAEPLPLDVQLGISKKFRHLPLRLFATAHHLYEWDIRYDNPADASTSAVFGASDTTTQQKSYFADKLFRHLIFGTELTLGNRILLGVSYNHLRRSDLALSDKKALAGIAFGLGINLNKLSVQYARSYYYTGSAYNEFGLVLQMDKFLRIKEK